MLCESFLLSPFFLILHFLVLFQHQLIEPISHFFTLYLSFSRSLILLHRNCGEGAISF